MTLICVPLMVEDHSEARQDAALAKERGADLVEYRVDVFFEDKQDSTDLLEDRIDRVLDLVEVSPLPCIVTCRPHWEGGEYHGDDDERVALYEALGTSEKPPAYIDVELATYTRSANIRQKINLAVNHPEQKRTVSTRLILSTHDFTARPSDLTRKIMAMQDEPACSVVKVAYRARSIRDNLELFEILRDRQKPTIALGMGEFGLMSRILAPKFGGFLTFASLRDESTTAPGQITIDELVNLYRFRSITPTTKVYGIIGWPITQSMSPMVHNAGFEAIGWDGVYVPMPVAADPNDPEGSDASFKGTIGELLESDTLCFSGASVTIPHKERTLSIPGLDELDQPHSQSVSRIGAANTIKQEWIETEEAGIRHFGTSISNSDGLAIELLVKQSLGNLTGSKALVFGAGGAAKAAVSCLLRAGANVFIYSRSTAKTKDLISTLTHNCDDGYLGTARGLSIDDLNTIIADIYINCTPVGMKDGPDPDGLSIPIPEMDNLAPETVFFDTVYTPIETPMLKAAKERGYRTIDGVQMFVKQAEAQFEIWTGQSAPDGLFDRLVREKLGS
jgi:3-dehydroquinate dehydratase / shikimate dehydrogenase